MANAILTTTIAPQQFPDMPRQALVAILTNGVYQLTYERTFDNLAPSLASAIVPGAALLQASPLAQSLLLKSVAVDFNDDSAEQELYDVPIGFELTVYRLVIRNASTSLTTASISFGYVDPTYADVVADATYTELTGPTLETSVFPKAGALISGRGSGGNTLSMLVNTAQGAPATGIVDIFGYFQEV